MTSKRSRIRRPASRARELAAFSWLFRFGTDYCHDLDRHLGVRQEDLSEADIALAWARLGQSFMATWEGEPHRPLPWAHERYGPPTGLPE
jgi:hypothetical protein